EGRFISDADNQQRRNVMVIGVNAAEALFANVTNRIGTDLKLGGINFQVIGILEKRKASFFGENTEDNAIFIPIRTAQKLAPGRGYLFFIIRGRTGQLDSALAQSEEILRRRRTVSFNEP